MKKILFVLQAVRSGGSAISMLNLLELLKKREIDVDVFLLEREGVFLSRAENVANVLPEEKIISSVLCKRENLKSRGITSIMIRLAFVLSHKIFGIEKTVKWFYQKSAKKLSGKYDVVISYQESLSTEYVQYIEAEKKIAWFHTDYDTYKALAGTSYAQVYEKYDNIVCVTDQARMRFIEDMNLPETRVCVIRNTIPMDSIIEKASAETVKLKHRSYIFMSMGRFSKEKGYDRLVTVANRLKANKIDFIWYIIGCGDLFETIAGLIKENDLMNDVILLGLQTNPFPYIEQSDCFIMTSRYEAQPMVLNEALTLGIPVITTRFASVTEVIQDNVNGLIVNNDEDGLYEGITEFVNNKSLRERLISGAESFSYNNEEILNQVLDLL